MRKTTMLAAVTVVLAGLASGALAHGRYHGGHHGGYHGGHHGGYHRGHGGTSYGFYLGAPLWWGPAYRPYPYYYGSSAPAVVIEPEPTVYVQRQPIAPVTASPAGPAPLWFYCAEPAGYYPYVEQCSRPWLTVDPNSVVSPTGR